MTYERIRGQVADEIALQDGMDNQIDERPLPPAPSELFSADEHTKIWLPRIEAQYITHTIVTHSPEELAHVFDAAGELAGGYYAGKDVTILHESQHADTAERLGQNGVRFLARLIVGAPFNLPDGRRVRNLRITPSVILEDVRASRLGVGLFLASPEDTAEAIEDARRIEGLGYRNADEVIRRAVDYNTRTCTNTYPIPPHVVR